MIDVIPDQFGCVGELPELPGLALAEKGVSMSVVERYRPAADVADVEIEAARSEPDTTRQAELWAQAQQLSLIHI